MSGLVTNVTGFAPPTSFSGFMGLLQTAMFRGVPFKVIAAQVKKGRRQASHEYPYVDGGWLEDMGRSLRMYSFSGYLIGDLAPVMQLLLDNAVETKGPGLLIHPTIGAVQVSVASATTAVHRDRMRVIEVAFQFVEAGSPMLPATIIATIVSVLAAADTALTALGTDLQNTATPAAMAGPPVTGEAQTVVASFAAATVLGGANPTAIVGMAAALPPPDANTSYGRYGAGSATTMLPAGTTVASLQAQLANQRAAVALAAAGAGAAAGSYSASTDMADALATLVEAMRAGITDPADQVQVLLALAAFTFTDQAGGVVGIGAAMAAMRDAMAAACRRAALVSLARASASYQPVSYNDAASLRTLLAAALDSEITAAGDAGEDASYVALKALRSAVVLDLTVRGANLPSVVTVSMALPLPALLLAQILYQDASRSDQIIAESGAIHPAFCPTTFQALAAGTGPTVNPSYVLAPDATTPLIAPAQSAGAYQLSPPGAPISLAETGSTGSTLTLTWSPAVGGGLAAGYIVQVSPTGADAWTTAGTVGAVSTSFTVTGLAGSTAYDFQVFATNAAATSPPSAVTTAATLLYSPNAPAGVTAVAGSPAYSVVALSWTASVVDGTHAAAATYLPQFALASGGGWSTFGSAIAGTSVGVTGLAHGTAYNFQVIAANTGGTATSGTASASTAAAVPNAVTGLSAAAGSPAYSVMTLTWTAPAVDGTHDAATTYAAYYGTNGTTWTLASGAWSSGVTASVTGLAHNTAYYFRIVASNAGGAGGSLATGSTTSTAIAVPNAVTGLSAAAGSPAYSVMTLSWTASAVDGTHDAATSYAAYYSSDGTTWTLASGAWSSGVTASVTGLAHNTAYYFQVVASNAGGTGGSLATASTTSTAVATPNVPTGLAAGTLLALTTTSIGLTWTAAAIDGTHDAATSYTLQYRVTSVGGAFTQVTGLTGTSHTITGLTIGTQYDFQIDAVNGGGSSAFTATANGTTFANSITVNYVSPSPFAHGSGPAVNVTITTPTANSGRAAWGSSATTEPTIGWAAGSNYSGSLWAWYLSGGASASAGTVYLWIEAQNATPATIGLSVTGPYTVT